MRSALMLLLGLPSALAFSGEARAAVGCTLNDPDRDIRRLFPEATGYRTDFITIDERGGEPLAREIQEKLDDAFDSIFETNDVPYAFYTVLKGTETIGFVHGVNQKGMYGGLQLILATDLEGEILEFYYQKMSSPEVKLFRDKSFTRQFQGLTLADFYDHAFRREGPVAAIRDPSRNSAQDFAATIRGLRKNLILFDAFILGWRHDAHYREVRP
ncbi:MAG: hypothetical protein FJY75_05660 [Candidatus Eisenbacteria bacterium]|uniref:TPM domain-containing protein n=1 Tax=Eiseniibacteriota bacterium TaxID=2212470 RepID=A0A937XB25_UNCEI|nr:hypothetical protein [Candidatus Eisenbacteria bacterium]